MAAYYNEMDGYAAQWLRNLIAAGHIAPGDVDERSITEVQADDLKGYVQCHFFAGIGVWSHALRRAGWPDDMPVWTGSCPCQPFSTAGKQKGFDDERHLWPVLRKLIATCRPSVFMGEQVASALAWYDHVAWDMENIGVWTTLHKNMHEVQKRAALGELPQVFWEIAGWVSPAMPRVPAGLRKNMAFSELRVSSGSASSKAGQEQSLHGRIQLQTSGGGFSESVRGKGGAQGNTLRSIGAYPRDRVARAESAMRNDGLAFGSGAQSSRVELPLNRPHRTGQGLRSIEHSDCVLCNERGFGIVGRNPITGNHDCLAGKEIANDERAIANAFEVWVASALGWLDLVSADMEGAGYAIGAADLCAAGFGGAHIRQRLYFVGVADNKSPERKQSRLAWAGRAGFADYGNVGGLANTNGGGQSGQSGGSGAQKLGTAERSGVGGLELTSGERREWGQEAASRHEHDGQTPERTQGEHGLGEPDAHRFFEHRTNAPMLGRDAADWLLCRDGRWRPVEPGAFPLVDETTARVGRLRAYGNALDAETATQFAAAVLDTLDLAAMMEQF